MALNHKLRARVISPSQDYRIARFKYRGHVWLAIIVGCAVFWYAVWQVVT